MLPKLFFISLMVLVYHKAWSFDHLACDSSLDQWTVANGASPKDIFLYKSRPQAVLEEEKAKMLLIQDEKGQVIASVLPLNGIHLFKSKKAIAEKYKFSFEKDDERGFHLEMMKPGSLAKYVLSCRFTF